MIDEDLAVLCNEHRRSARRGIVVLRKHRVDYFGLYRTVIDRSTNHPTRSEIVAITRMQREERCARVGRVLAVVDERFIAADDAPSIALDDPRSAFVFRDS